MLQNILISFFYIFSCIFPIQQLRVCIARSRVWSIKPSLPYSQPPYPSVKPSTAVSSDIDVLHPSAIVQPWEGRAIATHKFHLFEFSAYMELQREETVSSIKTHVTKIDRNSAQNVLHASCIQWRRLVVDATAIYCGVRINFLLSATLNVLIMWEYSG